MLRGHPIQENANRCFECARPLSWFKGCFLPRIPEGVPMRKWELPAYCPDCWDDGGPVVEVAP